LGAGVIPRLLLAATTVVALVVLLISVDAFDMGGSGGVDDLPDLSSIDLTDLDPGGLSDSAPTAGAIRTFEGRTDANPSSFIDYTILGQLHARHSRETGDPESLSRAEAALRRALDINPAYTPARAGLAAVFLDQHRFQEAAALARQINSEGTVNVQALATLADASFAMGDYAEATSGYLRLASATPGPAAQVRLARLEHLRGNVDEALRLTRSAAAGEYAAGGTAESVAWYLTRVGDLYLEIGDLEQAARHFESALTLFDRYYDALAGLAQVRAAQGELQAAISLYERSVQLAPQPGTLAQLGDVYQAAGNTEKARAQYDAVVSIATTATSNPPVYNRELAMFYADHAIRPEEALRLAEAEIAVRRDVYGYDLLAWALFRNDRHSEAAAAIEKALEHGTRLASFHFHAALIREALGDADGRRGHVAAVARINPRFSLLHTPRVRADLAWLAASR
jgi:tetratricopeptide (TPR) repeat protein